MSQAKLESLEREVQRLSNINRALMARAVAGNLDVQDGSLAMSESRSELLGNMSHEIRAPLNGLLGMTEVLLLSELSPDQTAVARSIRRSAESLLAILNDVLDLSRIETGRLALEPMAFSPLEAAKHAVELARSGASAKGLTLNTDFEAGLEAVLRGDPGRLRQVLTNLLGNAIKFTERGEVKLSVRELERSASERLWRFEVQDSGCGVSPEVLPQLFQAFTHTGALGARRCAGTGLGLALVKQLVVLMGGEVGVHSEPGRGSTFWFSARFEAVSEDAAAVALRPSSPLRRAQASQPNAPVRVLVAEDQSVNREVAVRILEHLGCSVEVAIDGEQARDAACTGHFDVVFMDCQMPGMDGIEATRAIREAEQLNARPHTPIVAITADALSGDRERCLAAGMDDFVSKPFAVAQLRAALSRWTRLSAADSVDAFRVAPQPAQDEGNVLDQVAISQLRALRRPGRPNLLSRLLGEYLGTTAPKFEELDTAVRTADHATAARLSHALKSISASLGATGLSRTLSRIEDAARAKSSDALRAELDVLRRDYRRARAALTQLLQHEQRSDGGEHG